MSPDLSDLTIVSITFNNNGISNTIDSVLPILNSGGRMVIQNGGDEVVFDHVNVEIYTQNDTGIYDALNKGIQKVKTDYFMLIHAGDTFIGELNRLEKIIQDLALYQRSISVNSQFIGSRIHSSRYWRPWMLYFGAQPPHLPTIYESIEFKEKKYSMSSPVIGDFEFFFYNVNWEKALWHNQMLIKMEPGGVTSSGFSSFITVSYCFYKRFGIKGISMILFRAFFKLIQTIK